MSFNIGDKLIEHKMLVKRLSIEGKNTLNKILLNELIDTIEGWFDKKHQVINNKDEFIEELLAEKEIPEDMPILMHNFEKNPIKNPKLKDEHKEFIESVADLILIKSNNLFSNKNRESAKKNARNSGINIDFSKKVGKKKLIRQSFPLSNNNISITKRKTDNNLLGDKKVSKRVSAPSSNNAPITKRKTENNLLGEHKFFKSTTAKTSASVRRKKKLETKSLSSYNFKPRDKGPSGPSK